jgi:nucleoside-diphosphate-sugar epimerase
MNLFRLVVYVSGLTFASAFVTSPVSRAATTSPLLRSSLRMVQGQGDSYKKVFVAGGSKGVGRIVVDKLVSSGSNVVALVRSEESAKELSALEGVTAIRGDALDYKTVEGAMDGCDAAITTLGGGQEGADGKWIDYIGNNNVIEAAGILGVTR